MEEEIRNTETEEITETSENAEEAETTENTEPVEESINENEEITEDSTPEETFENKYEPQPEKSPYPGTLSRGDTRVSWPETKTAEKSANDIELKFEDLTKKETVRNSVEPQPKKSYSALVLCVWMAITIALCGITGFMASRAGYNKAYSQLKNDLDSRITALENKKDSPASQNPGSVTVVNNELADIVEGIQNTVVEIYTETVQYSLFYGDYVTSGAGSGVIISSDGYIVTNNHVIENAKNINVVLHNGEKHEAVLVGTDQKSDVAVIKIEASGLQEAKMGTSSTLRVGDACIAIGNPLGTLGGSVTTGIISALSRDITIDGQKMNLMQTDTAINPGNSGGGLFNLAGELIGVVNAKSTGDNVEGIGFAIPIDVARNIVNEIREKGYVTRPVLGIRGVSIENDRYKRYYEVNNYGVLVREVSGKNAKAAGLQEGDLIIAMDDRTITSFEDLTDFLNNKKVGDRVTVTVERKGSEHKIAFELEANSN